MSSSATTTVLPETGDQRPQRALAPWHWAGWGFVILASLTLLLGRSTPALGTLSVTFVSIVIEAIPFVMLGATLGGLVEEFVSPARVAAILPRRAWKAIPIAGLLGIVLPICECAVIPVTRRLVGKGVPFSAAVAYLLAGPIVNPVVAGSTAVAYGGDWRVVAIRLGMGFVIAVCVAWIINRLFPGSRALLESKQQPGEADCCGCSCAATDATGTTEEEVAPTGSFPSRLRRAFEVGAQDFLTITQFLIIGAFAAALAQTFIQRESFLAMADTPGISIGLMMVLAVALNLCSEADAFVAASFRGSLIFPAQMAFLVLGPMLDLKLIAMYLAFVKRRALFVLSMAIIILVFVCCMALTALWGGPA